MEKSNIDILIKKYAEGNFNTAIRDKFQRWLIDPSFAQEKEQALSFLWDSIDAAATAETMDHLDEVHRKIDSSFRKKDLKLITLSKWKLVAAIIVLPLLCSLLTLYVSKRQFSKTPDFVECYAGTGEQRKLTLPDGSKVELNYGSLLIYPKEFTGNERNVFLEGEAHFSVHPNKSKPFTVKTKHVAVTALGTVFDVIAYSDVPRIIATLEKGKIKVDIPSRKRSYLVDPNEQVIYNNLTGESYKQPVDAQRIGMWRQGYLVYQGASFEEITHGIEKKYGVKIHFENHKFAGKNITVRFAPEENLKESLDIMRYIVSGFNYEIKENNVYIY